ncbi:hypothetical protein COX03_03080 [Candidatus Woesebacteria bacterium CG22_combo_CG10-13_8_21_14_all_39_10]|uniref:Nudix hydrolase domain-containing protein n=1 Tax=Candidatus Woesebacteria bacterium CG22_combo_CG10-13_8_21_14_all_39_10 TaxID=1975059 RepID=A0A2H0BIG2_9BACT|nr:MAG: hypothetical protein COX03_03080 [Candidatus Woesebacteria bacterium CG22_combo_CG10-13_8_21_14_all_39_10]
MKSNLGVRNLLYRRNVSCILFKGNNYLLVQLADWEDNWWKFPQGGIKENETEEDAIRRELFEELNISNLKVIAKSKYTNLYDWPEEIVKKRGFKWRGQDQVFYLVEYLGDEPDIKISDPHEVRKFQWVTKIELFNLISQKDKIFSGYKSVIKKIFKEYAKILS